MKRKTAFLIADNMINNSVRLAKLEGLTEDQFDYSGKAYVKKRESLIKKLLEDK